MQSTWTSSKMVDLNQRAFFFSLEPLIECHSRILSLLSLMISYFPTPGTPFFNLTISSMKFFFVFFCQSFMSTLLYVFFGSSGFITYLPGPGIFLDRFYSSAIKVYLFLPFTPGFFYYEQTSRYSLGLLPPNTPILCEISYISLIYIQQIYLYYNPFYHHYSKIDFTPFLSPAVLG